MCKKITFLLLALCLFSCKNSNKNEKEKIKAAQWLLGTWENKSTDGTLSETWKKVNDSTFEGESYFVKSKDTIHAESIILQQKGEQLIYNTTIKGQNGNKPMVYPLTEETENHFVFENRKQDYPQKIQYKLIAKDRFSAEISGIQASKPFAEKYLMTKIK